MNCVKVSPISFKGAYKLQGSDDILNEICWYLQKKRKMPNENFDFLNIRLVKKSLTETQKLLNNVNLSKPKVAQEKITEHIMDLIDINHGRKAPFRDLQNKENIDLFLTNKDKIFTEKIIVQMVEDSVRTMYKKLGASKGAGFLLDNLKEMRMNLFGGKPIINIKPKVVVNHLKHLTLPDMPILKAQDAYEGIKNSTFNIVNGIIV